MKDLGFGAELHEMIKVFEDALPASRTAGNQEGTLNETDAHR